MARYGMLIDAKSCNGCKACMTACKAYHNIPFGQHEGREYYRIWPAEAELGTYPYVIRNMTPLLCMQCESPPCMEACPVPGGIYRRDDGLVLIDENKCTGCRMCLSVCPYDALYFREDKERVDKCTFCVENIDNGSDPECVKTCPSDAMYFGDLDDPASQIRHLIKKWNAMPLNPEYGTEPSVYYTPKAARLKGVAVNKKTGHVIQGAKVSSRCLEDQRMSSVTTDSDGVFFFWSLGFHKRYSLQIEFNEFSSTISEVYLDNIYTDLGLITIPGI